MTTTRTYRPVSPPVPGLSSRGSSPASTAPVTPVMASAFPQTGKMAQQRPSVGIASPPVSSAYRIPGYDERFVMRAFASHASHCPRCANPEHTLRQGQTLCRTGTELARDLGQYFFCLGGKPFSTVDRDQRREQVQVEVPVEYIVIKSLFEALAGGLRFSSLKQRRTEVHQPESRPTTTRTPTTTQSYEIRPLRTSSRRDRSNTYTGYTTVTDEGTSGQKYETRTPYDEPYRDLYKDEPRSTRRESKRGSLYVPEERQTTSKRTSYVLPIRSGWLR